MAAGDTNVGFTPTVSGPGGRERKLKYLTRFKIEEGDEVIVFRFMRPKPKTVKPKRN